MASSVALAAVVRALAALAQDYAWRARRDDALGRELARVLALLELPEAPQGQVAGRDHPVLASLESLPPGQGPAGQVLDAFRPLLAGLPWRYGYAPRAGLENRLAWAELVGPEAPLHHAHLCLGLTALAPHTTYPRHHHPAVETYYLLSGSARWQAGDQGSEPIPGDYLLHGENLPHAMTTGDTPLLAAYTWTGAVAVGSVLD